VILIPVGLLYRGISLQAMDENNKEEISKN
jgi:hypothetical protein